LQVAKPDDFLWLGTRWSLFALGGASTIHLPRSPTGQRLARLDALNQEAPVLREGWVFLAGTTVRDGVVQPVLIPLIERPVRLTTESLGRVAARTVFIGASNTTNLVEAQLALHADGEAELIPLIDDLDLRADLLEHAEFGRGAFPGQEANPALVRRMPALWNWIERTVAETGLDLEGRLAIHTDDPLPLVGKIEGVRVVLGSAVYAAAEAPRPVAAAALKSWSRVDGVGATSFGTLYPPDLTDDGVLDAMPSAADPVLSPFVLSPSQARVVAAARTRPLTVASGAPGTGKTHAVAAVALDHVARGQSVLVATRSRFAARSIADLIHRVPGPNALRFGDIVEGSSVVDELNDHLLDAPSTDAERELARCVATRDGVAATVLAALDLEALAADAPSSVAAQRVVAPRCFDLDADLEALTELADAAGRVRTGLFARFRQRRAEARLAEGIGAAATDLAAVDRAIEQARRRRAAIVLAADGGTVLAAEWDRLAAAQDAVHLAVGAAARERQDRGRRARGAVAELLAAMRAGRGKRRQLLAEIDADALTAAVPLWIGTLGDIEDLLPAHPGTFDLVILDEAAHIDQLGAAPALLRAERAVVVGDPRQLRHVSFLSDDAIATAMAAHGVDDLTATIDLRRNSVFDRAAALAPVVELSEHYRSVPHLVEFPLAEFYRDRVDVMTRRPDNDTADAIDKAAPPEPGRPAEVETVIDLLRVRLGDPLGGTVGVITPFREHADAIEATVLAQFDEAEIRQLGLRIGTVHGFQGAERDTMILALGLGPDDPPGRLGFLENRNLFNVMVTRARNRAVVVTTEAPRRAGLLTRFLAHADRAPAPMPDLGADDPWTRALADELARADIATRAGYALGPWTLELVLDDPDEAIVFETCVAEGDPQRHLARHQALAGLGWRFVEAYPTRWDHDVARAALDLPDLIAAARRRALPPPPAAPDPPPSPSAAG
jgi:hypothetical protein